jgi:hypothetical protein
MGGRVRKVVSAPPEGGAEIDHRRIAPKSRQQAPRGDWHLAQARKAKRQLPRHLRTMEIHYSDQRPPIDRCRSYSDVPLQQCAGSDAGEEHSCSRSSPVLAATAFLVRRTLVRDIPTRLPCI